jgi:hypothetical protein
MRDWQADLELCEKATPGKWICDERVGCVAVYADKKVNCIGDLKDDDKIYYKNGYHVTDDKGNFMHWEVKKQFVNDAEFIAAAREGWPAAIQEVLRLQEALRTRVGR